MVKEEQSLAWLFFLLLPQVHEWGTEKKLEYWYKQTIGAGCPTFCQSPLCSTSSLLLKFTDTSQMAEAAVQSRDLIFRGSDLLLSNLGHSVLLMNFILNYFLVITNATADNRIMNLQSLRCCEYRTSFSLSEAQFFLLTWWKNSNEGVGRGRERERKILIKIIIRVRIQKLWEVMVLDIFNVFTSKHQSFVSSEAVQKNRAITLLGQILLGIIFASSTVASKCINYLKCFNGLVKTECSW